MFLAWVSSVCAATVPRSSSPQALFCLLPVACPLRPKPTETPVFYWTIFAASRALASLRLPRQLTSASQNGTAFWTEAIASTSWAWDRFAAATMHGFLRPASMRTFWPRPTDYRCFVWTCCNLPTKLFLPILTRLRRAFGLGTLRPLLPVPLALQPSEAAKTTFAA